MSVTAYHLIGRVVQQSFRGSLDTTNIVVQEYYIQGGYKREPNWEGMESDASAKFILTLGRRELHAPVMATLDVSQFEGKPHLLTSASER